MPFSRKNEYFELEFFKYTLNRIVELTTIQIEHEEMEHEDLL